MPVITEFWPYGIERSGISRKAFVDIVRQLFAHFYVIGNDNFRRVPIARIDEVFEIYRGPREFGLIALVPIGTR
jgi:hypothetical protein